MSAVHQTAWWSSTKKKDWCTPPVVLDLVRKLGPIGLDPCSNPLSIVGAKVDYQLERGENGLARPWRGHGLVFVNPPYGPREIAPWTTRARIEFGVYRDGTPEDECVLLLPSNTETVWFHRDCVPADARCCWKGRLAFLGAKTGATFSSLLVYWGPRRKLFRRVFSTVGWCT